MLFPITRVSPRHRLGTLARFTERLELRDWDLIGEGSFGAAWAKGRLVWKTEAYCHYDGGCMHSYTRFINMYARGGFGRSRHLPRVKLHLLFKDGSATLMERLDTEFAGSEPKDERGDLDPYQILRTLRGDELCEWKAGAGFQTLSKEASSRYDAYVRRHPDLVDLIHTLQRWVRQVNEDACDEKMMFDLHGENIMTRSNGDLVVIDPVS